MIRAIILFLLVGSASPPDFAADGDAPAIKRRVFRNLNTDSPAIRKLNQGSIRSVETGALSRTSKHKTNRTVAPISPVSDGIIEPPIPALNEDGIVEEGVAPPLDDSTSPAKVLRSDRETDAAKAIGIAQTYYRRGLWESAAEWYLRALDWEPDNVLAAEGFIMSAFHAGRYNYAYRMSGKMSETIPHMKERVIQSASEQIDLLLKQKRLEEAGELLNHFPLDEPGLEKTRETLGILQTRRVAPNEPISGAPVFIEEVAPRVERKPSPLQTPFLKAAGEDYRTDHYAGSLWNLEQAEKEGSLPRSAQLLRGWNFYHTQRYREAAALFENLYQTQTDKESARGIVVSLRKEGNHERLGQLVEKWGGILAGESKAVETTAFDFSDIKEVSDE